MSYGSFHHRRCKELVEEKRKVFPTEIIVQSVDDIPYYHLKDEIQEILDSGDYKSKMADPGRIECKHAMYSIIQYSKFPWVKKAIELNPHDSDPLLLVRCWWF